MQGKIDGESSLKKGLQYVSSTTTYLKPKAEMVDNSYLRDGHI